MALFQHEDAIILGMLMAEFFPAALFGMNLGKPAFMDWLGGNGGILFDRVPYGTGRGGITEDPNGASGRPGASDGASGPAIPSLAGHGGKLTGPGVGLHDGQFFFGGKASTVLNPLIDITSAGGGAGLFGGGSAFIMAGGGGGSSWVWSDTEPGQAGYNAIKDGLPNLKFPDWFEDGPIWLGISEGTTKYYNRNKALFTTNTMHLNEYEGYRADLGKAYDAFIDLHRRANGNGLILISKVNQTIEINRNTGEIDGIDTIVEYDGHCKKWVPSMSGAYQFILWGAQGGTLLYTDRNSDPLGQSFTGGFGGAVSFIVTLPTHHYDEDNNEIESALYLRVGQRGSTMKLVNPWNGGGNGVNASAGGGETSVRWKDIENDSSNDQLYFRYRIATAGGGGGCVASGLGGVPQSPFYKGSKGNGLDFKYFGEDGSAKLGNEDTNSDPMMFLVNDRSVVYVTIKYYSSSSLPDNSHAGCLLYINNGKEGVLYDEFSINPVAGTVELKYNLSQVYPANTETHWVTLIPEVRTNTRFIVPEGGVHIRVETEKGVNEPEVELIQPLIMTFVDKLKLVDKVNVQLVEDGGDIYISHVDTLNIVDTLNLVFKVITDIRESVLDKVGITDKSNVWLGSKPLPDIILSILDGVNLVDLFNTSLVSEQAGDISKINLDTPSISDKVNVDLVEVETLRLSFLDSCSITDTVNIKTEV